MTKSISERQYNLNVFKCNNTHTTYCVKPELNNRSCIEFIESCDPGQTLHGHGGYSF